MLIYEYGDRLKCQVVEYLRELFNKVLTENLHFNVGGFPPPHEELLLIIGYCLNCISFI